MINPNLVHLLMLGAGWSLVALGIVIAPLPGPLGAPVMALGGFVLVRRSRFFRKGVAWIRGRFPEGSDRLHDMSRSWPRMFRYLVVRTRPKRFRK